ncbi:MAG: hypothetical protein U5M50_05115 [Sphingobium sp.]|nr:hypothetical protein [Sphingobium sp.]
MRLNRAPGRGGARALLAGAFLIGAWTAATAALHINFGPGIYLARLLFLAQDYPVLILGVAVLAAIAWLPAKERPLAIQSNWRNVGAAIACFALLSWAGHYLVLSDYAMTRDEQMSELASRYLAQGRLGMPIPDQWQPFARAILPIFYSPFGADHVFASVYLPVSSAVLARGAWHAGRPQSGRAGDDEPSGLPHCSAWRGGCFPTGPTACRSPWRWGLVPRSCW